MSLIWSAVGTWAVAALGGLAMASLFMRHQGMRQSEREAIGPLRVLPHVGLAVTGFGLWVAYAVTDNDAVGWAATAAIGGAFLIAGTFLLTRDQHRLAELGRGQAPAAGVASGGGPGAAAAAPVAGGLAHTAEQYIPISLASVHGLLGAATLVLVLLNRAGLGGS